MSWQECYQINLPQITSLYVVGKGIDGEQINKIIDSFKIVDGECIS